MLISIVDFREKVSLFERRPNDTPIELWNVILDNKPSNQTFDEWIKNHSNNGKNLMIRIKFVRFLNAFSSQNRSVVYNSEL
jgi:hypothetical protein